MIPIQWCVIIALVCLVIGLIGGFIVREKIGDAPRTEADYSRSDDPPRKVGGQ